jgi:ABC-type microcin C transport system duplicated ATPase subunit YejF
MSTDAEPRKGGTLLQIRDLVISGQSNDQWHPIVNGVSLALGRGEVVGLVGESGAGSEARASPTSLRALPRPSIPLTALWTKWSRRRWSAGP